VTTAIDAVTDVHPVIVVGAGPAGLATAGALAMAGVGAVVLERAGTIGSSWRGHYDRLRLHTARSFSHLPGLQIPASEGRYVSRDGVIRYLEAYAARHGIEVRTGIHVARVERGADHWLLQTSAGPVLARQIVMATGYNHTPLLPDWRGREDFTGELLHASRYRNGAAYAGRDVIVVGTGNTGAEIAVDLAEHGARQVMLSFRTPPHILRRDLGPVPSQLTGILLRHVPAWAADLLAEPVRKLTVPNLERFGLPDPGIGAYRRAKRGEIPILDVGLIDQIQRRRVQPVPAVVGFDGPRVELVDGRVVEPDAVIAATGYLRGLEPLVGHLGLVGSDGRPIVEREGVHASAPGLRFIGYTNPISGMFRELAIDARRIAAAVATDLGLAPAGQPGPAAQLIGGLRQLAGQTAAAIGRA
jgi:putative flavoprotein involved in K+ transport